jgi:hypothetical protein
MGIECSDVLLHSPASLELCPFSLKCHHMASGCTLYRPTHLHRSSGARTHRHVCRLFQSTRVPNTGKDELVTFPDSRHIVVQHGPDFFKFDIVTADGGAVPQAQIEANIRAILATPTSTADPVGILTSMDRNEWASARKHLIALSPGTVHHRTTVTLSSSSSCWPIDISPRLLPPHLFRCCAHVSRRALGFDVIHLCRER